MLKVSLLVGAISASAQEPAAGPEAWPCARDPFTDSAKFERWSHFKDYGVPAVMGKDALNSAAIADGTCRFVQQHDGFYFWHYPSRVERVLQALADAPPTSNPSRFVLSADKALREACSDKSDKASRPEYTLESLAGSVQNWYHALTAPSSDPSWKGQFDPAYQPQQVAITAGLMCITACDLFDGELSESAMSSLAKDSNLREAVNATFNWAAGNTLFSNASSVEDLAHSLFPLLDVSPRICQCKFTLRASEWGSNKFCPNTLRSIFADMHDGDKKKVTISNTQRTNTTIVIYPSNNHQAWAVKSHLDSNSCSASINFNVTGKPNPPPVNLQANLWYSLSSKGKKKLFEFTDPSGTLAKKEKDPKDFPLNLWVEEVEKEGVASYTCPKELHVVYADMHDGDKKEVIISGTSLTIRPSGNNQTWVVKAEVDPKTCSASIDFNVTGKPSPPPVNLQATLVSMIFEFTDASGTLTTKKSGIEFTDPSGTLAAAIEPLNHWVEISKKMSGSDMVGTLSDMVGTLI